MVNAISNQQEATLYNVSVQQALTDKDTKKQHRITKGLFIAAPIVDSALFSAMAASQTKSLAKSLGHFGKRLAIWGLLIGFFNLASKGIDKATEKSKTLSNLKEKTPVLKTLIDLSTLWGGFKLASLGYNKVKSVIPESITKGIAKRKEDLINIIDSSKISKNMFTPAIESAKTFMSKHVKLAGGIKTVLPYTAMALMIASLVKGSIIDNLKLRNKVATNYVELAQGLEANNNIQNQD